MHLSFSPPSSRGEQIYVNARLIHYIVFRSLLKKGLSFCRSTSACRNLVVIGVQGIGLPRSMLDKKSLDRHLLWPKNGLDERSGRFYLLSICQQLALYAFANKS